MLRLEAPGVTASIDVERGGRLASLNVRGRELLIGPAGPNDSSVRWGCYLMAPWPGRLANGRFAWRGRTIQLPRTHGRHAIHGLVWSRPWRVDAVDEARTRASLACELPRDAWPMGGTVRQTFTLTARGLTMDASIEAADAMPAALGWHPWFARGGDPVRLTVDAGTVQEAARVTPSGREVPAVGRLDLRDGPLLGRRRLDHAYLDARSPAVIDWPDLRVALSYDPSPAVVVVHTPAGAVCVEPQTAPPNALALEPPEAWAAGVRLLETGETLSARLVLTWR